MGAPPRHVRGDGDGTGIASRGDGLGLFGILNGIEEAMGNACSREESREFFTVSDCAGPHEAGLAEAASLCDVFDDGAELCLFRDKNTSGEHLGKASLMARDDHDGTIEDFPKLTVPVMPEIFS